MADINAVTKSANGLKGWNYGAVGFYFIPSVNLNVTSVSYLDVSSPSNGFLGVSSVSNANPIISFWAGSNSVLTSFALAPGSGSGLTVSSNVSFNLVAGQPYSITLQDGPLFQGNYMFFLGSTNGQFQVASQLTSYDSVGVISTGAFSSDGPDFALFGPNFAFTVIPEPSSLILTLCATGSLLTLRARSRPYRI
jgi:hypothetical protein